MPYLPDPNTYLHQSSLLLQAYPSARVTTKYSLPRRPNPHTRTKSKRAEQNDLSTTATANTTEQPGRAARRRELTATLTLKTFEPNSGLCLKYRTDKAAEVGRLMMGLGKLAGGEVVEVPVVPTGAVATAEEEDKMDVDSSHATAVAGAVASKANVPTAGAGKGASGAVAGAGGADGEASKAKKKKGKR